MLKKTYSCDVCREEKSQGQLIGCDFTDLKKFKLSHATATDGVHICKDCLKQLKEQIPMVGL
jgi:hypothetical protein